MPHSTLSALNARLQTALARRQAEGRLRSLPAAPNPNSVDFSSNDYLGLSRHPALRAAALESISQADQPIGGTGARLLTGNSPALQALEGRIAATHNAPAALLFGSGYDANSGLLATLPTRHDIVLYDELCHASLREGLRLCAAHHYKWRHNDTQHLTQLLHRHRPADPTGQVYILTESVFSMDGDTAPLQALAYLCHQHQALLIVDEAHGLGVVGPGGWGLSQHPNVAAVCAARVYTYGKAAGAQGAAVVGSTALHDYLLNFCSAFIYTTAPGPGFTAAIGAAYDVLHSPQAAALRAQLEAVRSAFLEAAQTHGLPTLGGEAAIVCVPVPGAEACRAAATALQAAGYDVRPILSPTVPHGAERLRFCLHANNTPNEAQQAVAVLVAQIVH